MPSHRPPSSWSILAAGGLALGLFVAFCFAVFGQGASGETVSLDEYAARLEAAEREISAVKGFEARRAVRRSWEDLGSIVAVTLPEGGIVAVRPLFGADDSSVTALRRISVVRGQLQLAKDDRAAERLATLDSVLASDAMNPQRGLLGWLRRLLSGGFEPGSDPFPQLSVGRAPQVVMTVIGGLVAAAVLGLILQALLGNFVSHADLRARQAGSEEAITAEVARRRAHDLAEAGSYRDAVRQLYLATLLTLEDRGLLGADRTLTNREVLARVGEANARDGGELQAALRPVVDVFETVWYGLREPDLSTFDAYRRSVDAAVDTINAVERPAARPRAPMEASGGIG